MSQPCLQLRKALWAAAGRTGLRSCGQQTWWDIRAETVHRVTIVSTIIRDSLMRCRMTHHNHGQPRWPQIASGCNVVGNGRRETLIQGQYMFHDHHEQHQPSAASASNSHISAAGSMLLGMVKVCKTTGQAAGLKTPSVMGTGPDRPSESARITL